MHDQGHQQRYLDKEKAAQQECAFKDSANHVCSCGFEKVLPQALLRVFLLAESLNFIHQGVKQGHVIGL